MISDGKQQLIGCIDMQGQEVIKPIYQDLEDAYQTGIFLVKLNGKYGLLTIGKGYVVTPQFEEMEHYIGMFIVKKSDKIGIINVHGKIIVPLKYERFLHLNDKGVLQTFLEGKKCLIDMYGNESFI